MFPGQPVALANLAATTEKFERTLFASINRFGARFDVDLWRHVGPSRVLPVPPQRPEEEKFDLSSPLLVVDGGVSVSRVAEVVAALKARGARLAVRGVSEEGAAFHKIRLIAAAPMPSSIGLIAKGGVVIDSEVNSKSMAPPNAVPPAGKPSEDIPKWLLAGAPAVPITPARVVAAGSLPISEVIPALDRLAEKGAWQACLVTQSIRQDSKQP